MKSVTEITNQIVHNGPKLVAKRPVTEIDEQTAGHVNDVFRALQGAFPAWRSAFPDDAALRAAKSTWVKAFIDSGTTDFDMIARGVRKSRLSESPFFPSVGEFIAMCKPAPEDFGLPLHGQAYREACNNSHQIMQHNWSHPGVYETGRRIGWFEIRNGSITEKQFREVYLIVCEEVAAGASFLPPAGDSTKLERHANGEAKTTQEAKQAAQDALAELRKGLGL